MKCRQWLGVGALTLALAGCGLGHVPPAPTYLDLGAPPEPPARLSVNASSLPALALSPVVTSGTLSDTGVVWRVGANGVPNTYASYRWTAAPATLVRERLYARLSLQGPVVGEPLSASMPQLKVVLLQFEQVYSPDGTTSEAVVNLQAVLVSGTRVNGPHRVIERVPAAASQATAGAVALRTATDRAVESVATWVAQTLKR